MTTIELTDVEIELDENDTIERSWNIFGPRKTTVRMPRAVLDLDLSPLEVEADLRLRDENAYLEALNENLTRANGILKHNLRNVLESSRITLDMMLAARADARAEIKALTDYCRNAPTDSQINDLWDRVYEADRQAEIQRSRADVAEWEFEQLVERVEELTDALTVQVDALIAERDALQARVNELEQPICTQSDWEATFIFERGEASVELVNALYGIGVVRP